MKRTVVWILCLFILSCAVPVQAAPETGGDTNRISDNPNYSDGLPRPWLDTQAYQGIAYFLYAEPASILRYDLANAASMPAIPIDPDPNAFLVGPDGIFLGHKRQVIRLGLDGGGKTILGTFEGDIVDLLALDSFVYVFTTRGSFCMDKHTGEILGGPYVTGRSVILQPDQKRIVGVQYSSPAEFFSLEIMSDGTLGSYLEGPFRSTDSYDRVVYSLPDPRWFITDAGNIFFSNSLADNGSLGEIDDLAIYEHQIIVSNRGLLTAYNARLEEIGSFFPAHLHNKIYVYEGVIYLFYGNKLGIQATQLPPSRLNLTGEETAFDPARIREVSDQIETTIDGTLLILDNPNLSVHRWSLAEGRFLESISLSGEVVDMAYSGENDTLYLAYPRGQIRQVIFSLSPDEIPFAQPEGIVRGIFAAGEFLIVDAYKGNDTVHSVYDLNGAELSRLVSYWEYFGYTWNSTSRKILFLRSLGNNSHRFASETVDPSGQISMVQIVNMYEDDLTTPLIISPDGSRVITGDGWIFDGESLDKIGDLDRRVLQGVWTDTGLITLHPAENGTRLIRWNEELEEQESLSLGYFPDAVIDTPLGLVIATVRAEKLITSIYTPQLSAVDVPDFSVTYLPILASSPAGTFVDDFSDPNSGWLVGENSYVRYRYLDGMYSIATHRDGNPNLYGVLAPTPRVEQYTLSVDVDYAGNQDGYLGLLFDVIGNFDRFHGFFINPFTRQCGLFYVDEATEFINLDAPMCMWYDNPEDILHLQIRRGPYGTDLFINGYSLHMAVLDTVDYYSRVGVFSIPFEAGGDMDAHFDNFVLDTTEYPHSPPIPLGSITGLAEDGYSLPWIFSMPVTTSTMSQFPIPPAPFPEEGGGTPGN